jgi:hypothetical protein
MATKIKGTVTRVLPDTGNFFMAPEDPVALRNIDVDGHRVGDGEISAGLLNANRPKFRPYGGALPKVGDEVDLELIRDPEA